MLSDGERARNGPRKTRSKEPALRVGLMPAATSARAHEFSQLEVWIARPDELSTPVKRFDGRAGISGYCWRHSRSICCR